MSVHENLVKALNILETRGWSKGWRSDTGRVCVVHAIFLARGDKLVRDTSASAEAIVLRTTTRSRSIPSWNDDPSTTYEMVVEAFNKAIAATAPQPEELELDIAEDNQPELVAVS